MTEEEKVVYTLGQLYRLLSDAASADGASEEELECAKHSPMEWIGRTYILLMVQNNPVAGNKKWIDLMKSLSEKEVMELFKKEEMDKNLQFYFAEGYAAGIAGKKLYSALSCERKKAGLTQEKLAAKIKVTQKDISRWENGKVVPSLNSMIALSGALGCKIEDLIE